MYEKEMLIGSMQKRHLYGGEILLVEISLFFVEIGSEAAAPPETTISITDTMPILKYSSCFLHYPVCRFYMVTTTHTCPNDIALYNSIL